MITPDYCRMMARYGRWQNGHLIGAADGLSDAARREDRGSFFGSIHATLSHLLWADQAWISRFDQGEPPGTAFPGAEGFVEDWAELCTLRSAMDDRIGAWANGVDAETLDGDLTYYSGLLKREVSKPLAICVTHFFNHQTHHRGQVHAMLTAAGTDPGVTDLFMMDDAD